MPVNVDVLITDVSILLFCLFYFYVTNADRHRLLEIRVGNNPISAAFPPLASGNAVCFSDPYGGRVDTADSNTSTIVQCNNGYGIPGRYVSIQYVGATTNLTLCEVNVFVSSSPLPPAPPASPPPPTGPFGGPLVEMAFGRAAFQSSDWSRVGFNIPPEGVVAARAIDGQVLQAPNTNPYCAQTSSEPEPWW